MLILSNSSPTDLLNIQNFNTPNTESSPSFPSSTDPSFLTNIQNIQRRFTGWEPLIRQNKNRPFDSPCTSLSTEAITLNLEPTCSLTRHRPSETTLHPGKIQPTRDDPRAIAGALRRFNARKSRTRERIAQFNEPSSLLKGPPYLEFNVST